MAAISAPQQLPDGNFPLPQRKAPAPPVSYWNTVSTQSVNDAGNASESESANPREGRRRRGSFSNFLRRASSRNRSQTPQEHMNSSENDVRWASTAPATRIAQAQQEAAQDTNARKSSFSGSRKISGDGFGNMLRKSSKMKKAELERLEQERIERQNQPAPRLPSHNPLPGIDSFGAATAAADPAYTTSAPAPRPTNFSRPSVGGGVTMPVSTANSSSSPAYAIRPANTSSSPDSGRRTNGNGEYVPESKHAHSESMANRGRYSYSSTAAGNNVNSPRRVRRRKDPTPFNVLVIGAKNSGKTSFIQFLRHSLALPYSFQPSSEADSTIGGSRSSFTSHYLETEMDGERVGLTLWDSAGLEKNIVDLQLREMTTFVESKFEETFAEEQKVVRSPGVKDTHIHCVFLVLDPIKLDATVAASSAEKKNGINLATVSGLDDELDLMAMRALWGKTTVIPVIAKADTLTIGHMAFLKRAVWQSVKAAKMDPLEALELEDDTADDADEGADENDSAVEGTSSEESDRPAPPPKFKSPHKRQSSINAGIKASDDETPYIPMSVLSPDIYDLPPYVKFSKHDDRVGRRFAWGFADPKNPEHCDFARLRDSVFIEWRGDLRDLSRNKWYENWRTSRLNNVPGTKQRIKGGVTPVAAVPTSRHFSGGSNGAAASTVPRVVSAHAQPATTGREVGNESRNGSYRNVDPSTNF